MPALPTTLTTTMRAQATTALRWLKEQEHSGASIDPDSYTLSELRVAVLKYYLNAAGLRLDAKAAHNVRATTLIEWFPGVRVSA